MRAQRIGVACLLLAATITLHCAARDTEFFEDFSSGWDSRWVQSSDQKYNGKFQVESPKNLDDQALKVRVACSSSVLMVDLADQPVLPVYYL